MAKLTGSKAIEFIQGDSYQYTIYFSDSEITEAIDYITFSCKKFDISEQMIKGEDGKFTYNFVDDDTKNYESGQTTYDITINFLDGTTLSQTGVYLKVIAKRNPVAEE